MTGAATARSDRSATGYDIDTMADDLAAVIGHFDLHEATLVAHSLGSKEAIRYRPVRLHQRPPPPAWPPAPCADLSSRSGDLT